MAELHQQDDTAWCLNRLAESSRSLSLGVLSDLHFGTLPSYPLGIARKDNGNAEGILRGFTRRHSQAIRPTAAIQLGDLLEELPLREDVNESHLKRAMVAFDAAPFPTVHVLGNHDVEALPLEGSLQVTGIPGAHYSFDIAHAHVVILNSNAERDGYHWFALDQAQLAWLRDDLLSTNSRQHWYLFTIR